MSIESFKDDTGFVKDPETARVGATAEDKLRGLSKKEEIEVNKEDQEVLNKIAGKLGDKAMEEYEVNKEKNPKEILFLHLDNIAAEFKEKGLGEDVDIIEKLKERIKIYIEVVRDRKEKFEDKNGIRAKFSNLLNAQSQFQVNNKIPVACQIGENGGQVYSSTGFNGKWFGEEKQIEDQKEKLKANGMDIVNFKFSKEGETEFYRALGILKGNEEAIDIPKKYEDILKKSPGGGGIMVDPREFAAEFPTNIEGIGLVVKKDKTLRSYESKEYNEIYLTIKGNTVADEIINGK